jgi:precorrin-2 dehydrogenase / sirohydrochlorin ferrochelatase
MFPVFLDLTDRLAVVVGGPVGRRRAASLRAAGALVRVICLEERPGDELDARLVWFQETYTPGRLDGASLVIAAGPPEINAQVVADARARGIWVNCASAAENGDFHVPAVVRRGDLLLAVSTGGASPTLTRLLRQLLEAEFDEAFGRWVLLLAHLRPLVLQQVGDALEQQAVFEKLCRWHWLERLRCEGMDVVRSAMLAELKQ